MPPTGRAELPQCDRWVICASGPSMIYTDVAHLRRFRSWRVMVINNTWELIPWAHVLYACDFQWWARYGTAAEAFAGQKWTLSSAAQLRYGINRIERGQGAGLCTEPGHINTGGNGGYQAINLAWHMGAKRIVLLGYDMHRKNGGHWHGEHEGMLSAPESHINAWRRNFEPLANDMAKAGVSVINATTGTALECFERMPMVEALKC